MVLDFTPEENCYTGLDFYFTSACGENTKRNANHPNIANSSNHDFVDIQLVEPAQASVTAAMSSGSWVDVLPLLPASLVAADAKELLLQMKKKLPAYMEFQLSST